MMILNAEETRERLPFPEMIEAINTMFKEGCTVPPRHVHSVGSPDGATTWLLMPAWQYGGRLGVKVVSICPHNSKSGLPALNSTFTLFDARNGVPLAHLDGNEITSRRTAAASALAARFLSRSDATRLLVVGAGRVASLIPDAYRAVREIRQVWVWDIDPSLAESLAGRLRDKGWDARRAHDLPAAVARADIISCATLSTEPLVLGAWLQPGTHLDLIGSFTPEMRETDAECLARGRVFVDTEEAGAKSGDLVQPIRNGVLGLDQIQATLSELCGDPARGRRGESEITVFKAVGSALEDLAVASLAYDGQPGK